MHYSLFGALYILVDQFQAVSKSEARLVLLYVVLLLHFHSVLLLKICHIKYGFVNCEGVILCIRFNFQPLLCV